MQDGYIDVRSAGDESGPHCTEGMKLRLLIHKRQPSVQFIIDIMRYL